MYDPYTEFTKSILPNGLEVHSVFWDRPWIRVEIVVHGGGREDPVTIPGLAHFVEHLVSKNIPNWEFEQVKEFFDDCGGVTRFGSTNYYATRYSFSVPADLVIFQKAITIFGSMLMEAQIEKKIELERKIISQEFNGRYPFIEKLKWDMSIREALFKGHRLETWNRPLGRPGGFLSATKEDLQGFYNKYYVPANISLVVIGGIKTDDVITEFGRSPLGKTKGGVRNKIPQSLKSFPIPEEQMKIVNLSDYSNLTVDQAEYKAVWAFPSDFPKQARIVFGRMLCKILGDEIRMKRGLAYSVGTKCVSYQDVCEYEIGCRISPSATSYINDVVRECIEMVPSRRDLFDRKLRHLKQRLQMVDISGRDLASDVIQDIALDQQISTIQEDLDDLRQVTHDQMMEATSLLSSEKQYTFIICP